MSKLRRVEVKNSDEWKEVHFSELKKGDTFRMFEPDGESVKDLDNKTDFLAISDVYINKESQPAIDIGE